MHSEGRRETRKRRKKPCRETLGVIIWYLLESRLCLCKCGVMFRSQHCTAWRASSRLITLKNKIMFRLTCILQATAPAMQIYGAIPRKRLDSFCVLSFEGLRLDNNTVLFFVYTCTRNRTWLDRTSSLRRGER